MALFVAPRRTCPKSLEAYYQGNRPPPARDGLSPRMAWMVQGQRLPQLRRSKIDELPAPSRPERLEPQAKLESADRLKPKAGRLPAPVLLAHLRRNAGPALWQLRPVAWNLQSG